jgi:hypothetical protein
MISLTIVETEALTKCYGSFPAARLSTRQVTMATDGVSFYVACPLTPSRRSNSFFTTW